MRVDDNKERKANHKYLGSDSDVKRRLQRNMMCCWYEILRSYHSHVFVWAHACRYIAPGSS